MKLHQSPYLLNYLKTVFFEKKRSRWFSVFSIVFLALLSGAVSPLQAVISGASDPAGTYNLRDRIQFSVDLSGPQEPGVGELRLIGRDIYGNLIDEVVATATIPALAGAAANQQPETATVVFEWVIPNDGTLHNNSEGGYTLRAEIPSGTPGDPLTISRSGVRIDVTPNLQLAGIELTPGTYRAGDIIQITTFIRNRERSGNQTRPIRPLTGDTYRTELFLTRTSSEGLNKDESFLLTFFDISGSRLYLGPVFGSDVPDGRSTIRKVEVRGTPSSINTFGRDYLPQPDDGFLDVGEMIAVTSEVMIPWNFTGEYYVAGDVFARFGMPDSFPDDNTRINSATPEINIISSDEPKVDPVSERTGFNGEQLMQSNGASDNAAVSADGEWVAFESFATNLDPARPGNGNKQIYLRNTRNNEVKLISRSRTGEAGNRDSGNPAISGDGRFIAFVSQATNFVSGTQGAPSHIFVYDRLLDRTRRVSVNAAGVPANASAFEPSISEDGRFVVFSSAATNLDLDISNTASSQQVFIHDRDIRGSGIFDNEYATRMVSVGWDDNPANRGASQPRISMAGDVVVFVSRSSNLALTYDELIDQVWYREIDDGIPTGVIHLVSVNNHGDPGNNHSSNPVVNAGIDATPYGLQIAFVSVADNFVFNTETGLWNGDENNVADIFVRDFSAGIGNEVTTRVSVSNPRVAFGRIVFRDDSAFPGFAPNRPSSNPDPGDTIRLEDGLTPSVDIVFVAGPPANDNEVEIGVNAVQTRDNLVQVINDLTANGVFNFFAYASNTGFNTEGVDTFFPGVSLFNTVPGEHGNIGIIVNSPNERIVADGMREGGSEAIDWDVNSYQLGNLQPTIDRSGRVIAFRSFSRNLSVISDKERFRRGPGEPETPGAGEIHRSLYRNVSSNVYLRDRDVDGTGIILDNPGNSDTIRVSVNPFGYRTGALIINDALSTPPSSRAPALSANGRFVAFSSDATGGQGLRFGRTNRQPLDTNGLRDVFIFDRASVTEIEGSAKPVITLSGQTIRNMSTAQSVLLKTNVTGLPPITFQWRKNGVNVTAGSRIFGSNSAELLIENIQPSDAGSYQLVAQNQLGVTTSESFTLNVQLGSVQPAALQIQSQPASIVRPENGTAIFAVSASSSENISYQWFKDGSHIADGGNISGATTAQLQLEDISSADAGNYSVMISTPLEAVMSNVASLTVNAAPVITAQPQSATVTSGESLQLDVVATSLLPLRYQWFKNGAAIPGATGATYSVPLVRMIDAGDYRVRVKDSEGGTTFSEIAVVSISNGAGGSVNANLPTALQAATELGSGWYSLPWFGSFASTGDASQPWIYRNDLGWLFMAPGGSEAGFWLWSDKLSSWVWTSSQAAGNGFYYKWSDADWIFIHRRPSGRGAWILSTNNNSWSFLGL